MQLVSVLFVLSMGAVPEAGPGENVLRVDVSEFKPCVFMEDGKLTGHDIEVLDALAKNSGATLRYRVVPWSKILDGIKDGSADIAAGAVSITTDRVGQVDFSYPYFNSGLAIIVPAKKQSRIVAALTSLFTLDNLKLLGLFLGSVFVASFILWWADLGRNDGIRDAFWAGMGDAIWVTIVTSATVGYGDIAPKTAKAKVVAIFVMILGIGFFSLLATQLIASFTVQALTSDINGHRDLKGKLVATETGSTSVSALRLLGARVVEGKSPEHAYEALLSGKVDAVVLDAPVLQYYAAHEGAGKVQVVGQVFARQDYGFALAKTDPRRDRINQALLRLKEDDSLERIRAKYFGE